MSWNQGHNPFYPGFNPGFNNPMSRPPFPMGMNPIFPSAYGQSNPVNSVNPGNPGNESKDDDSKDAVTEQLFPPGKTADLQMKLNQNFSQPLIGKYQAQEHSWIYLPKNYLRTHIFELIITLI